MNEVFMTDDQFEQFRHLAGELSYYLYAEGPQYWREKTARDKARDRLVAYCEQFTVEQIAWALKKSNVTMVGMEDCR